MITDARRLVTMPNRVAVACQSHEREVQTIVVILKVGDLGTAGAGELVFFPGAVGPLRAQEIGDAAADRVTAGFAGRQEAEQRPAGLRGSRRAVSGQARIVVAGARLAPAAAELLHALQPADGPLHH